jgi:hypothetical protein
MILHRVADDVGDLDETSVVFSCNAHKNAPLHWLQTVGEIRNRAVADDVARVIQKPAIHARVQTGFEFFRVKRLVNNCRLDRFGDDVIRAVAICSGGFFIFAPARQVARLRWAIQAGRNLFCVLTF